MAAKKMKKNPAVIAARVEGRKKFVAEAKKKGVSAATARKRYYVQTRAAELTAAGKKVDKAALRKKFESGAVSRVGFYAPGDKKPKTKPSTKPSTGATPPATGKSPTDNKPVTPPKSSTPSRANKGRPGSYKPGGNWWTGKGRMLP